jgi:D-alanyl-D-alanine carboxypeptidase
MTRVAEMQISLFQLSAPSPEPKRSSSLKRAFLHLAFVGAIAGWCASSSAAGVPADIQAVFNQPRYSGATWGLRVVDVKSGTAAIDLRSSDEFLIGSVRKIFSVGELLDAVGPNHTYDTPIYRHGTVDSSGVLNGDLILVASGDFTMGGRTNPDGSIALSNYDHNEADSLGNAVLTAPDPLAGYKAIAAQVAATGITRIAGEVIIDDRLFQPYAFRGEFDVRPIFGKTTFPSYFDSLPILGVDGSLAEIGIGSPAQGRVFAKTGTFLDQSGIRAQVVAGYIDAHSAGAWRLRYT